MLLKILFIILHITTAAAWFGLSLRLAAQTRLAIRLDGSAAEALLDDLGKGIRRMGLFLVLTFFFALGAFLIGGEVRAYGPAYHTSFLLLIVLLALHFFMVQPAWRGLHEGAKAGLTPETADPLRKRIAISLGIGHTLWLLVLVLMFSNRLSAAL